MGIGIFSALALYVIVLGAVTWFAYRWAAKRGLSRVKCWLAAGGGFLAMYLAVFWDHVPTLIVHKYRCEKEAGFWIYKTIEQWKKENPSVTETLTPVTGTRSSRVGEMKDYAVTTLLSERFKLVVSRSGPLLFNSWMHEMKVVDTKTGEVLARYVDVSTGNGNVGGEPPIQIWLQRDYCPSGRINRGKFYEFEANIETLAGGKRQ